MLSLYPEETQCVVQVETGDTGFVADGNATLRYKSLGRLTKPTSPYSYEIAAKAL